VQVQRPQALAAHDSDAGIVKRGAHRADDVPERELPRIEHDDDAAGGSPQRCRDGITGAERRRRADDLVTGTLHDQPALRDDQHLGVSRAVLCQCRQRRLRFLAPVPQHDHDGGLAAIRLVQQRGHGLHRPMERLALLDEVRRPDRRQLEGCARVGHLPACRLDARLEPISRDPVVLGAGRGTLLGELHDVGWCC
jgi:hypothetical protein